jgi:hypothetical protein
MTGGAAFTLNVSPCPEGVNGTDVGHYLYLTGLPGAPEAVLITGGTCRSGRPVGTIVFTPANNHLGQWTLRSATAGLKESVESLQSSGGMIYVPRGIHVFYASAVIPHTGITIMGAGDQSIIWTVTNGIELIRIISLPGMAGATIRNLQFATGAALSGLNTVTAIGVLNGFNVQVDNVTFGNTGYAIYCDRCSNAILSNLQLIDNSRIFYGSTVDGGNGFSFNGILDNIRQYPTAPLDGGIGFIVTLQRVVSTTIRKFTARGLGHIASGITINNNSEGNSIVDCDIQAPHIGIQILANWVGATLDTPKWTTIRNAQIDDPSLVGVSVDNGGLFTDIQGTFTSGFDPATVALVRLASNSMGSRVHDSTFQNMILEPGILVTPNNSGFSITNNYFDAPAPVIGIIIQPGASDKYVIAGNTFTGTLTPISDGGTGTGKFITSNIGTNQYMAPLPAYANNAAALVGGLVAGNLYVETGTNPLRIAIVF